MRRRSSAVKPTKSAPSAQDRLDGAKLKVTAAKQSSTEQAGGPTGRSTAAKAEAARARNVASFLDELDTPPSAPAIKSAKLLASNLPPAELSSRPSTDSIPAARASSSSRPAALAAPAATDKPRKFSSSRSSDPAAHSSSSSSCPVDLAQRPRSKPSSGSSSHRAAAPPAPVVRSSALAGILALGESPEVGPGERVLSSVKTTTTTTAKVTASARPRTDHRPGREKENSAPREREVVRPLREGERYKVF